MICCGSKNLVLLRKRLWLWPCMNGISLCYAKKERWEKKGHNMNILWWMSRLFIFIYSCGIKFTKSNAIRWVSEEFLHLTFITIKKELKSGSEMELWEGVTVLMDNLKWIFSLTHVLKVRSSEEKICNVCHYLFSIWTCWNFFLIKNILSLFHNIFVTRLTNEPLNSKST
jgi:hypothetical protein